MHNHNLREEMADEVYGLEHDLGALPMFKPFKKAWAKLTALCQPIFRFHDKYIMYVLWAILLSGTACVVAWVMGR